MARSRQPCVTKPFVTASSLTSLDWALRGGAVALVLLLAVTLWRDHRGLVAARLGAAFAVGTGAYAITSAAGFSSQLGGWTFPLIALSSGNNVVFWAFTAALFDDAFRLRWWHAALWLLLVLGGFAMCMVPGQALGLALTFSSLAFAVLAIATTIASWHADLVERRRRLRLFVVGASALYIGLNAAAQLAGVPHAAPVEGSLVGALGLVAIAGLSAAMLLGAGSHSLFAAPAEAVAPSPEPIPALPEPGGEDRALLERLNRLMTVERAFRQDGLTIADLAQKLGLPEYRLRRLINQGLGHRNFNSFVNGYRIAEIKVALADPGQAEVPVLTLALDAGFSSLGPFNRAFKAETGLTPSEYRREFGRQNAPNPANGTAISESASRISNPARGIPARH
jgi:AraC-like DNA-binding protein